jgi:hypothetical protein
VSLFSREWGWVTSTLRIIPKRLANQQQQFSSTKITVCVCTTRLLRGGSRDDHAYGARVVWPFHGNVCSKGNGCGHRYILRVVGNSMAYNRILVFDYMRITSGVFPVTLSIKDRLEARIHIGQIISFPRLLKIMKSLGHTLYIDYDIYGTHIDYVKDSNHSYPHFVNIVDIFERENQIWSMGKMIMATVVKIEGVK